MNTDLPVDFNSKSGTEVQPEVPLSQPAVALKLPEPSRALPPVDFERLREITENDPAQLRDLITLFRAESGIMHQKLTQAILDGAMLEIRRYSHKFAGSSSTCGMDPLAACLHRIEESASQGDASGVAEAFREGNLEFARVDAELIRLAAGSGSSL